MGALGIVCEYNPFHLGHLFQMEEGRRRSKEELIICVMSGDYVQRGEAAMMTKYARAESACRCGADLVAELPLPWCLSSAEGFASGAVSILDALGCSTLCFGSETGELADLQHAADLLLEEETSLSIRELLRKDPSLSYAKARQKILERQIGEKAELLRQPNNILALEYLKAIRLNSFNMTALAVKRQGAWHDTLEEKGAPSAKKIRKLYLAGEDIDLYLPPASAEVLNREKKMGRLFQRDCLEGLLRSRLIQLSADDFDALPDAGDGAGRHLYKCLREGKNLRETVEQAASKRFTKARMRRMLLCASLGVRSEDLQGTPPYARLLACNEKGRAYLAENREDISIPVLAKPAAVKKLGPYAEHVFALGASAHDLYSLQKRPGADIDLDEDWKTGPVIV